MADTYMLFPKGYGPGADQYQKNGQDAQNQDQQSQLFKALLQQSMQSAQGGGGALGTAGHLLSQYMMMNQMGGGGGGMGSDGVFGLSMGAGE